MDRLRWLARVRWRMGYRVIVRRWCCGRSRFLGGGGDGLLLCGALARWRGVVDLVDVGILDQNQEGELSCMGDDGDKEYFVAGGHQGDTVVASVADRVHWVGCHLKDAIKGQFLVDEVEEITPVPGKVLDHSMGIEFDPKIKQHQDNAGGPSKGGHQDALVGRVVTTGYRKETVRDEVAHQDQVDKAPKNEPSVVLNWGFVERIVGPNLSFQFMFEQPVQARMWILPRGRVHEDLCLLRPSHQRLVVRLVVEEPSNPSIVAGTPEKIDDRKHRSSRARWKLPQEENVSAQNSQDHKVGQVLWFGWRQELGNHIVSIGHGKYCKVARC